MQVIFSFAQMNMNGVWEIIADRTPSRPRLVISRVSHNSILINGLLIFGFGCVSFLILILFLRD